MNLQKASQKHGIINHVTALAALTELQIQIPKSSWFKQSQESF
uniref:Uncharacterized protein n=1 Tax=Rhizophora mucronata TaxID=61149 RepID=A0A2P2JIF2_RHIMU